MKSPFRIRWPRVFNLHLDGELFSGLNVHRVEPRLDDIVSARIIAKEQRLIL